MEIKRVWAMPNKRTFQIKPIKRLLAKYICNGKWVDPFPYPFKVDALQTMKDIPSYSVDGVLYDPPYSLAATAEAESGASLDALSHRLFL